MPKSHNGFYLLCTYLLKQSIISAYEIRENRSYNHNTQNQPQDFYFLWLFLKKKKNLFSAEWAFSPRCEHNSAFSSSYLPALRHSVTSSHSQKKKTLSPLCRQRSCGEALWAQRVLVPPTAGAAASLSGPGLNTGCYCCWMLRHESFLPRVNNRWQSRMFHCDDAHPQCLTPLSCCWCVAWDYETSTPLTNIEQNLHR